MSPMRQPDWDAAIIAGISVIEAWAYFFIYSWAWSSPVKENITYLTHWGRVMHICVIKLAIIDSDNGLSPGQSQAIIWTSAGILLIGTLGANFSELLSEIHAFSFQKIRLKTSSAKWWPFCLGLNELMPFLSDCDSSHRLKNSPGEKVYFLKKQII